MFGEELIFGPLVAIFLFVISTVLLIYWYGTLNHDYWRKRGIPYAKPLPFIGSIADAFKSTVHEVEEKRYKELGPIYGHFEANKALLSVGDPALIREILVKDFQVFHSRRQFDTGEKYLQKMISIVHGEDWKRIRSILSPTFTTGKIKRMLSIFKECSSTLIQNFKSATDEGEPIDAKRLYGAYSMDIIASSAFSTKIDSHNDPENQFVKMAKEVFSQKLSWKSILFLAAPRLTKFFGIRVFAPEAGDFFVKVTLQIIQERKRTGQTRNDFLQLLLDTAKDSEDTKQDGDKDKGDIATNYGPDDSGHQIFKNVSSKHLSMDELIAQCVIFFMAGYDTTASTLSFATYLLAVNPHIQDKLHKEIDHALKETKGELTYEAIQSMKYLDNVISETLRIYPPGIRLERLTDADYKLGETGITIPKGMIVTIPVFALHRDPKFFPDPEKFDPERFSPEERAKRDQYSYLPFGAGPRNCIAMRFALMEVKLCLAHVIANFEIKRSHKTKVPLEFNQSAQGLLQPKEIIVELEGRNISYS